MRKSNLNLKRASSAKLTSQFTTARFVLSMTMILNGRRFFTVRSVVYVELVEKIRRFIVKSVNVVWRYLRKIIMHANLKDSRKTVLFV